MLNDLSNYNIEVGKDGRVRAYDRRSHKVTSYPRLLMENELNRRLLKTEDVHHIDGNPLNNDIDNLAVIDHREHDKMHAIQKYFDKTMICPICEKEFTWTAKQQSTAHRNRNKRNNSGQGPFCSNKCKGINNHRIQVEKGLANKYFDKIAICRGCGEKFLYTAKAQRSRRPYLRDNPYCSIECANNAKRKYTDELVHEIQETLYKNKGRFAETERQFGIPKGKLRYILKVRGLPYHKADYINKVA